MQRTTLGFVIVAALLALALWANAAAAQLAPPLQLSPPKPAAGDIIELDAAGIDPKAKSYGWAVTPKLPAGRKTIAPTGAKAILCSVPGTYTVFVAIADAGGAIRIIEQEVTVSATPTPPGPAPGPNPMPNPNPGPAPLPPAPLPDGQFGLAAFVAAEATALPAEAKARAPEVARAFHGLAAAMAAGGLTLWQVPVETAKAFDAAVGPQKPAWIPVSTKVQTRLRELQKAARLTTISHLTTAYREIAAGLESVK